MAGERKIIAFTQDWARAGWFCLRRNLFNNVWDLQIKELKPQFAGIMMSVNSDVRAGVARRYLSFVILVAKMFEKEVWCEKHYGI